MNLNYNPWKIKFSSSSSLSLSLSLSVSLCLSLSLSPLSLFSDQYWFCTRSSRFKYNASTTSYLFVFLYRSIWVNNVSRTLNGNSPVWTPVLSTRSINTFTLVVAAVIPDLTVAIGNALVDTFCWNREIYEGFWFIKRSLCSTHACAHTHTYIHTHYTTHARYTTLHYTTHTHTHLKYYVPLSSRQHTRLGDIADLMWATLLTDVHHDWRPLWLTSITFHLLTSNSWQFPPEYRCFVVVSQSPHGWLGVKHQATYSQHAVPWGRLHCRVASAVMESDVPSV